MSTPPTSTPAPPPALFDENGEPPASPETARYWLDIIRRQLAQPTALRSPSEPSH